MPITSLMSRHHAHSTILRGLVMFHLVQNQIADATGTSRCAFLGVQPVKKHRPSTAARTLMSAAVQANSDTTDYLQLFLNDTPLMDVRAQVEFSKGAFPNTDNFPILNDEHRALVGTCYKNEGQQAAKELGYTLVVESNLKEQLVASWKEFAQAHPNGYIYCFRGGLRSHITQTWMNEAGIDYPLVVGGYKAMRSFLMSETEKVAQELPIVLIGGRTASGKTHLLKRLGRHLDLEGLANHRGSSFGGLVEEQPCQIDFENTLGVELLKLRHDSSLPVFVEDESRRIGQVMLPLGLHTEMIERYPLVILETPIEERVQICIQDYVTDLYPLFEERFGPDACHAEYSEWSLQALSRVKKRLGGDRYACVHEQLSRALDRYSLTGDESGFNAPLETMLKDFYDPMYDYQLKDRKEQVLFRGTADEIVKWAKTYSPKCCVKVV